jgi:hypothetical protein
MIDQFSDELAPLKVTCTRTDCNNGLHCYLATAKMVREDNAGRCRSCGIALVDWERVHGREISDIPFTFECLRTEFIRHHFWHIDFDDEAMEYSLTKGMVEILENVPKRLTQAIGKAQPFRDGTQTPFHGRAVYYAQHATATCCRKCVEEWHGIPRGRALNRKELEYLSELVRQYLRERLIGVPDVGTKPTRKRMKDPSQAMEGITS